MTTTAPVAPTRSATDRANAAALTAADLPGGGWKPEEAKDFTRKDVPRASRPECEPPNVLRSGPKPAAQAERAFSLLTTDYEYVNEIALVFADEASAKKAAAHVVALARSCRVWQNGGIPGEKYAFTIRQDIAKATWSPSTNLIRWAMTASPDVPPSRSGIAVRRDGPVVVLVQAVFPLTYDRGAVGLREMTDLSEKLARRGAA